MASLWQLFSNITLKNTIQCQSAIYRPGKETYIALQTFEISLFYIYLQIFIVLEVIYLHHSFVFNFDIYIVAAYSIRNY